MDKEKGNEGNLSLLYSRGTEIDLVSLGYLAVGLSLFFFCIKLQKRDSGLLECYALSTVE
jgi:hypothetical protein